MSKALEANATINASPEVVWATLTDWAQANRWMSGVESMSADGPVAVGTKLMFRARGKDRPSEIVQVDPGRSMTLRSVQGGVTADYTYELVPLDGDSTRASLAAQCQTSGVVWGLLGPAIRFAMRRADRGQMDALKKTVEDGN